MELTTTSRRRPSFHRLGDAAVEANIAITIKLGNKTRHVSFVFVLPNSLMILPNWRN